MIINGNTEIIFKKWKKIFHTNCKADLINLISRDAIFYSPIVFKPQVGRQRVHSYLSAAMDVFANTNFEYIKKIDSSHETYAEFICDKDGIKVNGIDYIKNNGTHIIEFKVFLRPYKAIEIIWKEMENKLKKIAINDNE